MYRYRDGNGEFDCEGVRGSPFVLCQNFKLHRSDFVYKKHLSNCSKFVLQVNILSNIMGYLLDCQTGIGKHVIHIAYKPMEL